MDSLFSIALVVLILAAAGSATLASNPLLSVLSFVVFGVFLSLGWFILSAPDVALTEAAVGGGVTGALLLRAWSRSGKQSGPPRLAGFPKWLAAALSLAVTACLVVVVLQFPDTAPGLAAKALEPLDQTGLGNPVTATLMAYRALDTLLEKVVLLLALVGVWALARDPAWGGRAAMLYPQAAFGPLAFLSRILIPVGILTGIYLFWVGADQPGGAFAGGAVIAAMGLLAFFSGHWEPPRVTSPWLRASLVVGIAVFLAVGLVGYFSAGYFLAYPPAFAKPLIVVVEVAMTTSIAFTLALLVAGPPSGTT